MADVNIAIINIVRGHPVLYTAKSNDSERARSWKECAEKLKIQETLLKIKWYSLVQSYQRQNNFKYAKFMSFMEPLTTSKENQNLNEPEFNITENDICAESYSNEEYVFVEIDEFGNNADSQAEQCEFISTEQNSAADDCSNQSEITNHHNSDEVKTANGLKQELFSNMNSNDSDTYCEPVTIETAFFEEKPKIKTMQQEPPPPSSNVQISSNEQKSNERCEDVIFGELVSAMLKRMPEEKKRSIKKEIMNILLT